MLREVRAVRFLGMIAFVVLVLLTSWSGVRIIEVNYALQKEIAGLQAKNQVRQLENDNLKLKNQYLGTDTYLELTTREQFGKGAKDEKLILVPTEIALARAPKLFDAPSTQQAAAATTSTYLNNLRAWRDFYFKH